MPRLIFGLIAVHLVSICNSLKWRDANSSIEQAMYLPWITTSKPPIVSAPPLPTTTATTAEAATQAPTAKPPATTTSATTIATKINTTTTTATRPPIVFFLFLAVDKVSNFDIWKNFFATAPDAHYRAFIHCKNLGCNQSVAGSMVKPVRTWPSVYCTDLVSPMQQLLESAVQSDGIGPTNPADKFVFVSDSTLPAKPFSEMYSILASRKGSDFCPFPANEWADVPLADGKIQLAVKYHQWVTLERFHAEKAVKKWNQKFFHDLMSQFSMNKEAYALSDNSYADHRNFGCLDEFWHMAALYGMLTNIDRSQNQYITLDHWYGPPLQVGPTAGWQGTCDTFVMWSRYLHTPADNPFAKLYAALDPPSAPHLGDHARPGWWDQLSTQGITAMRNSDFLFIRKFIDKPHLVDGVDFAKEFSERVF